jgi:hypothetical protein
LLAGEEFSSQSGLLAAQISECEGDVLPQERGLQIARPGGTFSRTARDSQKFAERHTRCTGPARDGATA